MPTDLRTNQGRAEARRGRRQARRVRRAPVAVGRHIRTVERAPQVVRHNVPAVGVAVRHAVRVQQHRARVGQKVAARARQHHQAREPLPRSYNRKTARQVASVHRVGHPNIASQRYRDPRAQTSSSLQRTSPSLRYASTTSLRDIVGAALHATGYDSPLPRQSAGGKSLPGLPFRALAHPASTARGIGRFSDERSLEAAVPGYKSSGIPHVSPGKAAYSVAAVLNEARKGNLKPLGRTARDLGIFVATSPAGIVQAANDPAGTAKAFTKDLNERYAASYHDTYQRAKKKGAAAEIADLTLFGTPSAIGVGRGITTAARSAAPESRVARLLTEQRPDLRVSGNLARPQNISPNAFRAVGQRIEDVRRAKRSERRNVRASRAGKGAPGVQPRVAGQIVADALRDRRHAGAMMRAAARHGDPLAHEMARHVLVQAKRQQERAAARRSGSRAEVVPRFQKRAERIAQSEIQSRYHQRFRKLRHDEIQGRDGAVRSLSGLDRHERLAAVLAVKGAMPLDKAKAVPWLKRLRDRWQKEFDETGREGVGQGVKQIDELLEKADKVFAGGKLREFQAREVARTRRLEGRDRELSATTGEVARRRGQANALNAQGYRIENLHDRLVADIEARHKRDYGRKPPEGMSVPEWRAHLRDRRVVELAHAETRKPALQRQFVREVDEAAAREGLPEAGYVKDFKHRSQVEAFGPATLGQQAAGKLKKSELSLLSTGRADLGERALLQSLSETIKRQVNHDYVEEAARVHALPPPARSEMEAVLGYAKKPDEVTVDEWRQILTARGWDHGSWSVYQPGTFRDALHSSARAAHEAGGETSVAAAANDSVRGALQQAFQEDLKTASEPRVGGSYIIPREVANEIRSHTGFGGRAWDKLMGGQAGLLLSTNPKWLQFQVAANAFLSGFSVKGNPVAFLKRPLEWKHLFSPENRAFAEEMFGTGSGAAHSRQSARMGASIDDSGLLGWGRTWREGAGIRYRHVKDQAPGVRRLEGNPLFQLDNAQNAYFKKVVFTDEVKRLIWHQMAQEAGVLNTAIARLDHLFRLKPSERMRELARDPEILDRALRHTDNVLGNYVRYTAKERAGIRHFALFYGFMRYAVRTAFYSAPVHHPLMTAIVAKLSQLHKDEIDRLLGGQALPWAYGRILFHDHSPLSMLGFGEKIPGTDLLSIDLSRMSPLASPITDLATAGSKKGALAPLLGAFMSPLAQSLLDTLVYKKDSFTGRDLSRYSAGRILLNDLLTMAPPVREFEKATTPGAAPDTLPWSKRQFQGSVGEKAPPTLESILGALLAPYPQKTKLTAGPPISGGGGSAPSAAAGGEPDWSQAQPVVPEGGGDLKPGEIDWRRARPAVP